MSLINVGNTQSTCQSNPWLPLRYRHKWYHYFNRTCVLLPGEQGKAQTLSRDQNIIKNWRWAVLTWSSKPAPITTQNNYSNRTTSSKYVKKYIYIYIVLSDTCTGKSLSLSLYISSIWFPRATFYKVLPSFTWFLLFLSSLPLSSMSHHIRQCSQGKGQHGCRWVKAPGWQADLW